MPASIGVNLRVTGHCRQGGRKYMEDFYSVAYQQTEDEKDLEYAFFGIYDGHGGGEAATFAKEHLMEAIVRQKCFWSDKDEDVMKAIKDGYIATHYAMWKEQDKWPKTASGLPSTAGTTASVAFIRKSKIYIGHVGDSGIILGYQEPGAKHWSAKALTKDHKPENEHEMSRIEQSGGKVVTKSGVPRVVWNRPRLGHKGPVRRSTPFDEIPFLAVARSLGDLWSYNSELNEFVVSPDPDTSVINIDSSTFRCLIFGTDGLWNMIPSSTAVSIVQMAEQHNDMNILAGEDKSKTWLNPSKCLVERALERWSSTKMRADNTSVVTLMLDPPGPPRCEVLRRQRLLEQTYEPPKPKPISPEEENMEIMTVYRDEFKTLSSALLENVQISESKIEEIKTVVPPACNVVLEKPISFQNCTLEPPQSVSNTPQYSSISLNNLNQNLSETGMAGILPEYRPPCPDNMPKYSMSQALISSQLSSNRAILHSNIKPLPKRNKIPSCILPFTPSTNWENWMTNLDLSNPSSDLDSPENSNSSDKESSKKYTEEYLDKVHRQVMDFIQDKYTYQLDINDENNIPAKNNSSQCETIQIHEISSSSDETTRRTSSCKVCIKSQQTTRKSPRKTLSNYKYMKPMGTASENSSRGTRSSKILTKREREKSDFADTTRRNSTGGRLGINPEPPQKMRCSRSLGAFPKDAPAPRSSSLSKEKKHLGKSCLPRPKTRSISLSNSNQIQTRSKTKTVVSK